MKNLRSCIITLCVKMETGELKKKKGGAKNPGTVGEMLDLNVLFNIAFMFQIPAKRINFMLPRPSIESEE